MLKPSFVKLLLILMLCLQTSMLRSQALDMGVDAGVTGFLGDLGGANAIGRPFFFDLETSLTKPAASVHFRYYVGGLFSIKGSLSYSNVAGNDSLIQPSEDFSPEWYRWYLNLSFHSQLIEGAITGELNLKHFEPGSMRYRFAPYVLAGIGMIYFNPKASYNGALVALQPLHTEGQGFDSVDIKPYSLIQPVFPVGVGLRYNISKSFVFGFEFRNYFTLTDYIDDVSTSYVSQNQFSKHFSDQEVASLAYELSMRADEKDPEGFYQDVTAPGQQRGDANKDQYFTTQFSISYILFNNRFGSQAGNKSHIFPHKVHSTSQMFKHKKHKKAKHH
ncbi:MAG: DUF6089 family protein [Chitinophagales bacterium]